MLKWFWKHYQKATHLPLCFADFGMSKSALSWCSERGDILPIAHSLVKEATTPMMLKWQSLYSGTLRREAWFKKPLACARTPFDTTLWLDLDCEIVQPLEPLLTLSFDELALVKEPQRSIERSREKGLLGPTDSLYNSGVILFRKKAPFLQEWIKEASLHPHMGDQDALSVVLKNHPPKELPAHFNWRPVDGDNPHAVIIHHVAERGKRHIFSSLYGT